MFADSLYVVLLGLMVGLPTLLFLFAAYKGGHFNAPDQASMSIFDEEDLRIFRPWESYMQRTERIRTYGATIYPRRDWIKWL